MARRWYVRALLAVVLTLFTAACGVASLSWAVLLRQRLESFETSMVGDSEKTFMDECTSDFAHLSQEDPVYLAIHGQCLDRLRGLERFRWIPRVRLTADERICDPARLCAGRSPGSCGDSGEAGQQDYVRGDISECYELISKAKIEQQTRHTSDLLDVVDTRCVNADRWKDYEHKVLIYYCMWKHQSGGGLCMNSLLTNCPKDSSCCPVAQNYLGKAGETAAPRLDQYTCRKSPSVGLFCQSVHDLAPGNASGVDSSGLCTEAACPSFAWCQDLADIPGICLGEACRSYRRSVVYAGLLAACAVLGLLFDAAGFAVLIRYPEAAPTKSALAITGALLKFGSAMTCVAAGIIEFLEMTLDRSCFNADGNAMVRNVRAGITAYLITTLLSAGGSLCLSPFYAYRFVDGTTLPYAHIKSHN